MNGPTFLMFYAVLIVAAILGTRWFNRWRDPRSGEDLPPVPSPADPFELAWLRGGAPEAIRLAVYDLKQRGLLVSQAEGTGGRGVVASGPLDNPAIAPIDRLVLRACATPQRAAQLMRGTLAQQVDEACAHWRARHEEAGLLIDRARKVQGWLLVLIVMAALLLLSVARIQHALDGGHPFLFLILLTSVAVVLVPALGHPPARLTARGGRYLARLRQALAPDPTASRVRRATRASDTAPQTALSGSPSDAGSAWSPAMSMALLPIALHGMSAMPPVEQAEMQQLFPQAGATSSGSGCGSSSSCGTPSSSDGGSGDSGGGGGCGGCGGGGD